MSDALTTSEVRCLFRAGLFAAGVDVDLDRDMAEFDAWLASTERASWRQGFQSGWASSGEGHNGEYPDEGVPWLESTGYDQMLRLDGNERLPTD